MKKSFFCLILIAVIILICDVHFSKKKEISNFKNVDFDYICVFSPYTPFSFVKAEVSKYASSVERLGGYKESMDDGIVTFAIIKDDKLIFIGDDLRGNYMNPENSCKKKYILILIDEFTIN